jgi:hypothetical protein
LSFIPNGKIRFSGTLKVFNYNWVGF